MRIQSSHSHSDRGADAYFTPPEAVIALINIEREHIPEYVWEPACGDGAIAKALYEYGKIISYTTDLYDYGFGLSGIDYLKAKKTGGVEGIITNPPYKLAVQFATKAVSEVPYVALLLRTNFLEGVGRKPFFEAHPPARIWIASRRLPMMHRVNWEGPKAPSNTCHAWFIWDAEAERKREVGWYDWKEFI